MKGINHIITGVSAAIIADTGLRTISSVFDNEWYDTLGNVMHWSIADDASSATVYFLGTMFVFILNALMFLLGCLLPDCDQKNSIIGCRFHIPVEHRTWTHTIWVIFIFVLLGLRFPIFFWLAYGSACHLFCDSLSKGGVCWFYPISKYQKWTSGAQVKKNHKIYLYRTGEMSEAILVVLIAMVAIIAAVWAIQLTVRYGGLPFHAEWIFGSGRA